jgi:hypothetical protein
MQPTQEQVIDRAVTTAWTLRRAGLYLLTHGWHQGDMFADPDQPTPAACALGAMRMVIAGTPVVTAESIRAGLFDRFDQAVTVLADHLLRCYLDPDDRQLNAVLDQAELEQLVVDWNDDRTRIASHVIAAFYGAADEWDRLHPTQLVGGVA